MQTFIEYIAKKLVANLPETKTSWIVPGFRAKTQLQKQVLEMLPKPTLSLSVYTLQEFIQINAEIKPIERYAAAVYLFRIFRQSKAYNDESFESFYPKALTLISDFNFIDANLKDTSEFFTYLSAEKSLLRWQLDQQKPDDMVAAFTNFWNEIPDLYTRFKKLLLTNNLGYAAMLYDSAERRLLNQPKQHFYFIGFNASSHVELQLLNRLKAKHETYFFYDVDHFLFQQKHYSLNAILKTTKALDIPSEKLKEVTAHFAEQKTFNIQGYSNSMSLTQAIGQRIIETSRSNTPLHKIAIVLGDESLLLPIIEQLPQEISFNAGIGIKLS
ncbi:MAG: hypothetical protein RQ756_05075, partial [Flavobacteriaceae bacterium]|nr:hypothetical protein [Flavobacteriaceae bacterium]